MSLKSELQDARREAGFEITFAGELSLQELELAATPESANWVIELECRCRDFSFFNPRGAKRKKEQPNFPTLSPSSCEKSFLESSHVVGFQARIFQKHYGTWPKALSGMRVIMKAFVFCLTAMHTTIGLNLRGTTDLQGGASLAGYGSTQSGTFRRDPSAEGLVIQGNKQFCGAVFLTRNSASDLKILINREGFLPSPAFSFIREMTRLAIDLHFRQNSAAREEFQQARKIDKSRQEKAAAISDASEAPSAFLVNSLQNDAMASLREARAAISRGDVRSAR